MDKDGLCRAIDALDNVTASLVNLTSLSDRVHVEALREVLPGIIAALKQHSGYEAYVGDIAAKESI
jgi:hypothetical protein